MAVVVAQRTSPILKNIVLLPVSPECLKQVRATHSRPHPQACERSPNTPDSDRHTRIQPTARILKTAQLLSLSSASRSRYLYLITGHRLGLPSSSGTASQRYHQFRSPCFYHHIRGHGRSRFVRVTALPKLSTKIRKSGIPISFSYFSSPSFDPNTSTKSKKSGISTVPLPLKSAEGRLLSCEKRDMGEIKSRKLSKPVILSVQRRKSGCWSGLIITIPCKKRYVMCDFKPDSSFFRLRTSRYLLLRVGMCVLSDVVSMGCSSRNRIATTQSRIFDQWRDIRGCCR